MKDAIQDVFSMVYRHRADFEEISVARTRLLAICLAVAAIYRRRESRCLVGLGAGRVAETTDGPGYEGELGQPDQDLVMLDTALDDLSFEQRAVFTLFELEGVAGEEIARLLKIPIQVVYSRLQLAREAFVEAVRLNGATKQNRGLARAKLPF